ncbi:MAG: HAMP domain-containing protein [Deltaproteobacteria bacterium]|nr:HAMP domain-containing protein [Deltaproteobacteria bacterium]
MRLRQGVAAEVLISLALVMATGTALLAAVLLQIDDDRIESLHGLLGRGFVASAHHGIVDFDQADAGHWWSVDARGAVRGINAPSGAIDDRTRALALASLGTGAPLVESGAPWEAIRFAAPEPARAGAVAGRIDAPISVALLGAVVAVDVVVFVLFGWSLMRRRVVGPLRRLVVAVRELSGSDVAASVPVEGVAEIEELASAFNEMQVALAARTGALEKAVRELRTANANLIQAREGLDRAERLAMVGSLAAGVAHEVGNPMGALLTYLELAGRDPGLGELGKRSLSKAVEQGERVRIILRQLLDFSRPPRIERGPLDLADVASRVIELVSTQHGPDAIRFELEVAEGVVPARGDLSLALQILLNLAINAVAAVRGRPTRTVRFEVAPILRRRRVGEDATRSVPLPRVDGVVCRVSDTGDGVAAEQAERIFDPFFTTKPPGEGTGLGLANARRLAEEMGGSVELEPERAALGGACFRFVLPVADEPLPSDGVRSNEPHQSRMS